MLLKRKLVALAAPLAILTLGGCTTGFPAQVSRFQAMPAPVGESFIIEAVDPENRGGLEFSQYAGLVRQNLLARGYREANSRADASLVVSLDYGVDNGRERVVTTPGFGGGFNSGFGGGFGRFGGFHRPFYSRFGYFGYRRHPFYWGWHDPFWGDFGPEVRSFTVYQSFVDLDIRRPDGRAVFEGLAQAQSRSNRLQVLVPNLVEAMFTGFPGNNGETVRITVTDEERRRGRR